MSHGRCLASLLVSVLSLSPTAIGLEAPNSETIEAAKKASVQVHVKKLAYKMGLRAKPSAVRRLRWKRFRYEMGLKARAMRHSRKAQENERWIALKDM